MARYETPRTSISLIRAMASAPPVRPIRALRFAAICLLLSVPAAPDCLAQAGGHFCNPLDLPMEAGKGWRHAADPMLVRHENHWYLFTTWDFDGYRVSEDLIHWRDVRFDPAIRPLALAGTDEYCGPAVTVFQGAMLFIGMHQPEKKGKTPVLRSREPLSGRWEKCGEIPAVQDPVLFVDGGKLFLYHGLGEGTPTKVMELDPVHFTPKAGSQIELRPRIRETGELAGGIELGRREIFAETDTRLFHHKFRMLPCQEGAFMLKENGKYFLNYATPGTLTQWYADVVMIGDSPTGPFHHVPWSPSAMMAGGFIGGCGHGCFFQDEYGNWMRMGTMWIGVHNLFERRVGLFPAGFDREGRLFTDTAFGDYPQRLPTGPNAHRPPAERKPLWMLVSEQALATASSESSGRGAARAVDEDVRTWWAAASGRTGEWLALDLGEVRTVHAVQVNLAEHDSKLAAKAPSTDGQAFLVEVSEDGKSWSEVWDRSQLEAPSVHSLRVFDPPLRTRHLRLLNVLDSKAGAFAVRDLRVFGYGNGTPPAAVEELTVVRDPKDDRCANFRWTPVEKADGYVLRFGVAADALHLAIRIRGGSTGTFSTHVLNRGAAYHFRLDAFNENGVTPGRITSSVP